MAGQQSQLLPPRLNQDLIYLIGINDLDFCHPVGELLPQIRDRHGITNLQLIDVAEIAGPAVSTMTGDDAVCVIATDGQAGLAQVGRTIRHVLVGSSQINWHFQFHCRNGEKAKDFLFQSVIRQPEAGLLVVQLAG